MGLNNHHLWAIDRCDRWQVYHRLQELDIGCWCDCHQPLTVEVDQIGKIVQVWCVIRQVIGSRRELIDRLEQCWQISSDQARG